MPRPKKPSSKIAPEQSNLLAALRFLSVVTKDVGAVNETHVILANNRAVASNGILSAGCLIDSDITAAPNNQLFIEALSKCGHNYATTIANQRISIRSDKFKASIPCIDPSILYSPIPDNPFLGIDDKFKIALETISILVNDNAQAVYLASILVKGQSAYSSNGVILFEYWHGLDLPTFSIPKQFVQALSKIAKPIKSIGGSEASITVFFEDDSWLKTQTFKEAWPIDTLLGILNRETNAFDIPKDFYTGLEAVLPFSDDGVIWCDKDLIKSGDAENAATYEVSGLTKGVKFLGKQMLLLKPLANKIDFFAGEHIAFFGPSIRGIVAGRK